jgi:hypothetical protein
LTVRLIVLKAVLPIESVTVTTTEYGLLLLLPLIGVPVITPEVLVLKPVGKPVVVHPYEGVPPEATSVTGP